MPCHALNGSVEMKLRINMLVNILRRKALKKFKESKVVQLMMPKGKETYLVRRRGGYKERKDESVGVQQLNTYRYGSMHGGAPVGHCYPSTYHVKES